MFSYKFGEILKDNFFIEHLRWLLLRLLKFTLNQILHLLQIAIFWYKNLDSKTRRSSRQEAFCQKGVLKILVKSTIGKHLCYRLWKKRLQHSCFLIDFAKFLKTDFFTELLRCCFWTRQSRRTTQDYSEISEYWNF